VLGLDSQLDPIGQTRGDARTGILIFTNDIFVYKWLLLVIGEIISRNSVFIYYWLPLVIRADQVQACIK